MIECKLCSREFKNTNSLAKHLKTHSIEREDYYIRYIGNSSKICKCGKEKMFRDLGIGFLNYCSQDCYHKFSEPTRYWKGKKQSQDIINKRRKTIEDRYGVNNGYMVNHSVAERYKRFVCRSKNEKVFIDFCEQFGYNISVPQKIPYMFDGRSRYFYPDFYIKELDLIVEIKSTWTYMLHFEMNIAKEIAAIQQGHKIMFIDEEHGLLDNEKWSELNEHLLFG